MKVVIDKEEWYPVYAIYSKENGVFFGRDGDVSEEDYNRYKKVFSDFFGVQKELKKIFKESVNG